MARLRYALRSLGKSPLLAIVVTLSLGLGIGANTAIFSLLHQIILSSLPVPAPEQLVLVKSPGQFKSGRTSTNRSGGIDYVFSYRMFRGLEKQPQGLTGLAGFRTVGANIAAGRQIVSGTVLVVSGAYFPTLQANPLMGRTIAPEDDRHGAGNPVAVLGYGYWTDKLGGRSDVLNQAIRINSHPFTIVGVMPKTFNGTTMGREPDLYVPMCFKPSLTPNWNGTDRWDDYWVYAFGRLKPGVRIEQAAAALNAPYRTLVEEQAATGQDRDAKQVERFRASKLSLEPGSQGNSSFRTGAKIPLTILMISTALVLLIAMANAANLLLARSAQRRRELAIRAAMGAGRGELMGQMLTEAMLLAVAGGLTGLVFGAVTLRLLLSQMADDGPIHFLTADLNGTLLLFAGGLSLLTGLFFGLYPALDAARNSLAVTLKDESGQSSGTHGAARVRKALVCAQVTIAAVLLIPTGLFLKSLVNLMHVDLGMNTEKVIGFSISPSLNGYTPQRSQALFERTEAELAAIPGVSHVASAMVPLIGNSNWGNNIRIEGTPPDAKDSNSHYNEVGPGFLGKMGVPLIAGREFTEADNRAGPKVAVVNQTFVKALLGDRNPIGVHFSAGGSKAFDTEIVGIVKDSHYSSVKEETPNLYYMPWRQDDKLNELSFYVRTAVPPETMFDQVRKVMASIDRDLPLEQFRTLDDQVKSNIQADRLVLRLAATFAILATLLAMLGLYGVMAHSVTRRLREIGIRMALGAAPGRIRAMVMRELAWILGIGLLLGVPAALALAKLAESQLFGVKSRDAVVIGCAVLALAVTAALAGFLPARRASRVNPLDALRYE